MARDWKFPERDCTVEVMPANAAPVDYPGARALFLEESGALIVGAVSKYTIYAPGAWVTADIIKEMPVLVPGEKTEDN